MTWGIGHSVILWRTSAIFRIPRHELLAKDLLEGEIADLLQDDWALDVSDVTDVLESKANSKSSKLMASLLSGPIDIDKMDYLQRDSLHAGVPYGQNFDRARLISSLCLNECGDALAITEKGRTAAEMMVFARYVMFSEVYWHHAVRSATAMLQRVFYHLVDRLDLPAIYQMDDAAFIGQLIKTSQGTEVRSLVDGLFGRKRALYKRLEHFSLFQHPDVYQRMLRRPYWWLIQCAEVLADCLAGETGATLAKTDVLIDAPPIRREAEIKIDVFYRKENSYRGLSEVSPVARALSKEQFDDNVKRVRVFIAPHAIDQVRSVSDFPKVLHRAIDLVDDQ